jgi:hypothetical protein
LPLTSQLISPESLIALFGLILATTAIDKHHTSGLVYTDSIIVVSGSTASLVSEYAVGVDTKHTEIIKYTTFERNTRRSYERRYTWRSKKVKRSSGNAKIKLI